MGRLIVVVGFLLCFALALWCAFNRPYSPGDPRSVASAPINPVVLDDFVVTTYNGPNLQQYLAGGRALFTASDRVLVSGGIDWWRYKADKIGSVRAENATIFLQEQSPSDFMLDGELQRIIFTGQVNITINRYVLQTERATYLAQENQLTGREKVTLLAGRDVVTGEEGFSFNINDEVYRIFGGVKGVVAK